MTNDKRWTVITLADGRPWLTDGLYGFNVESLPLLYDAASYAASALKSLASNPAFSDGAPEFNEGGIGYEACQELQRAILAANPDELD